MSVDKEIVYCQSKNIICAVKMNILRSVFKRYKYHVKNGEKEMEK